MRIGISITRIQAGGLSAAAESIGGLVRSIGAEWPDSGTPLVVATGGLAEVIVPHVPEIERVEPHLTLIGLRVPARHLGLTW